MISMSMVFLVICMHCGELTVGSMYGCNCDRTPNDIFMHVQDFLIPFVLSYFLQNVHHTGQPRHGEEHENIVTGPSQGTCRTCD
jgi:hypothetical protein